ncbi:hypothetical protein CORC01_01217 [Colletotrichum orchidophilum]|uniref:Uncharacterized protein n=1 Tax=Colletotrichum orchidophilum TaxID=1209926 RepID=A0A1G4BQA5_9PEZI|nr:uncharacterized protein CORC01_01217 [Colletotrichum orchidophilum]OHF03498.1 hypothetical protein CORC01_01217 [Colletotrichum orchidophilum]
MWSSELGLAMLLETQEDDIGRGSGAQAGKIPKLKQSEVVDALGERYISPRSGASRTDDQVRCRCATSPGVV